MRSQVRVKYEKSGREMDSSAVLPSEADSAQDRISAFGVPSGGSTRMDQACVQRRPASRLARLRTACRAHQPCL